MDYNILGSIYVSSTHVCFWECMRLVPLVSLAAGRNSRAGRWRAPATSMSFRVSGLEFRCILRLYWGYIGIMEKKMETTIGFRV